MSLNPGTRLGAYQVTARIGAGGMGEVYRATDTVLGRSVAIKVLPDSLAADPERLARFEREARTLASLNHPNIAQIYGFEKANGIPALIMELVEGATLADRIAGGAIPGDQVLPIARQIAEALDAAHEQGIVHRDLKPANIKVRDDGTVKILDFGLAKLADSSSEFGDATISPTSTNLSPVTNVGVLLGTVAYMSPEQARGKGIDKRTDIWAFVCVLYEMLTGRKAFPGATTSDTIAAVLTGDPNWGSLATSTPPSLLRILRRCLEKDPRRRLRDIGDLRFEVDEAEEGPSRLVPDVSPHRRHLVWANVSVLIVLAAAAVVWWVSRPGAQATEVHVELTTPSTRDPISLAIAPDGRSLVFAASSGERQQLWLRALDSSNAKPLAGTDAARFPFWSADGRSVGFFADGKLLRMDIEGGAATILANAALGQGGAWNRDGTILFAPAPASGLFQIQADGGTPVAVTTVAGPQQIGHSSPQFLPDARHFLYYVEGSSDVRGVYVGELGRKESNRVVDADAAAVFSSGHLLFVRQGMLYAQRFDAASLTLTGVPFVVGEQPAIQRPAAAISASDDGSIAYRTGASGDERAYIWFDHSGKEVGRLSAPPGSVRTAPEFAPDGRTVVLHTVSGNADLWSVDVARGAFKRLTEAPADDILPIWSPDGARVAFSSTRRGNLDLYVKSASGTGTEDLLIESSGTQALSDWSPDGQLLAYTSGDPQTGFDIWMLPIDGNRKAFPVVQTKFNERLAQFSPDGKWIAYESNESGRYEIYLQRFSAADGKTGGAIPVSTNGGAQVRWRPDGKGLYYLAFDDRLMTVPITVAPDQTLQLGRPAALFTTRVADGAQQPFPRYQYNVSPDGQRFLMNTLTDGGTSPLILILNWRPES